MSISYYSNVIIVCDKKTFGKLDEVFKKYSMKPTTVSMNEEGDCKIRFDYEKWYSGLEEIDRVQDVLFGIDDEDDDDAFALFIRQGEVVDDIEYGGYGSDSYSLDYYFDVSVDIGGF